jgi:hypothetical protein
VIACDGRSGLRCDRCTSRSYSAKAEEPVRRGLSINPEGLKDRIARFRRRRTAEWARHCANGYRFAKWQGKPNSALP